MILKYVVENNKYETLKKLLKGEWQISSRLITKLKQKELITVNNKKVYLDYILNIGDIILVDLSFEEESENIVPTPRNLNILYEDEAYIVINKPSNLPVHPSRAHYEDTLSNGIKYYFNQNKIHKKIRPVNRLDRDTSRNCYFC